MSSLQITEEGGGVVTAISANNLPSNAAASPALPSEHAKIVEEFLFLLEKSQQLFAGLRDLPPTGRNWQPYFQRTFEVYTKLWKYQQQHRQVSSLRDSSILENRDAYGLKRWEIGEVASKIGQLYYHYYLRTSETNYLHESYVFYDAIRERQYFKDVVEAKNPGLSIKKLRYYARFIVVCLLLNRNEIIKKLLDELSNLVEEYISTFNPADASEWNVVLSEITTFLEAEKKLTPLDLDGNLLTVPSRLHVDRTPKIDRDAPKLKLSEVILVGNYQNQIKFSELTLDMYRMLQALEREPLAGSSTNTTSMSMGTTAGSTDQAPKDDGAAGEDAGASEKAASVRRSNPHKYLLYRPTFAQLMLYVSTCFKDISDSSALLLYVSADGMKRKVDDKETTYKGGVATAVTVGRKPNDKAEPEAASTLINCLHPEDLTPFTRKALFVVVDSNNSAAFKNMPKLFGQPLVCLMSPTEYPATIKDTTQIGSLFTLFLHCPVKAFAFVSDATQVSADTWTRCVAQMAAVERTVEDLFEAQIESIDKAFRRFYLDDFLRQFMVRFVVCHVILSMHTAFKDPNNLPVSHPTFPSSLLTAPELISKVKELTAMARVDQFYSTAPEGS
ncbi:hypothetical protein SmJEL517_g01484 [Synchytrium microbalum]|uniref:Protein SCAI n=1 Tax=Synchytrium microbalum TaxID=1806994 RepID=A0A507C5N1_9FUNG|nr:uncharacterized protein SmJEL517_g01484 [Synchytrium microbalum]TPX36317.1 hypothetical protein SmJEL517_g01484 [Synchytrium microbalum]